MKNTYHFCFLLFTFLIFHSTIFSQTLQWDRYLMEGRQNNVIQVGAVTDYDGNTYVVGSFEDSIYYSNVLPNAKVYSQGEEDVFIAKFNTNAEFQWIKSLGGSGENIGMDIQINSENNLVIVGYSRGEMVINNDTSYYTTFLAEFDTEDGTMNWYRFFEDSYEGSRIVIDGSDNIYIEEEQSSIPDIDIIRKLDKNGETLWTFPIRTDCSSSNSLEISDIDIDKFGNVYVACLYSCDALRVGNLSVPYEHTWSDQMAIFKLDIDGNPIWLESAYGSAAGVRMTVDNDGDMYLSVFSGHLRLDGQSYVSNDDVFLIKYNKNLIWEWVVTDKWARYYTDLKVDCSNRLLATGIHSIHSSHQEYIFEIFNTSDGTELFSETFGAQSYGRSISLDGQGNVYISGATRHLFGGGGIANNNGAVGIRKYHVDNQLQVRPLPPATDNIYYVCHNEPVPTLEAVGQNIIWYHNIEQSSVAKSQAQFQPNISSNENYFVTQTIDGCESWSKEVNVDFIEFLSTEIEIAGNYLCFDIPEEVPSFQWLFNGESIDTAQSSCIEYQGVGLYTIELCSNTAFDLDITEDLFQDLEDLEGISLFPNPATNYFNINHSQYRYDFDGYIFNAVGALVGQFQVFKDTDRITTPIEITQLTSGTYFIKLVNADDIQVLKLVKQ